MGTHADRRYTFVVVGATGAVGKEMLSILSQRGFPLKEVRAVASPGSSGRNVEFDGRQIEVRELSPKVFEGAEVAFFSAGKAVSREFAPVAAKAGAMVIDNSSAFRMEKDVPLVIPEVNGDILSDLPARKIIAVPNCAAIQMVMALAPIHRHYGLRRVVVSTYQAVSGAGRPALEELSRQVTDLYNYRELVVEALPHRIAFNVIPQIDVAQEDGMTGEEAKICQETKKILGDESIGVSATAVRIPVFHAHAESVNVETEKPCTAEEIRSLVEKSPGLKVQDDLTESIYPMPAFVAGTDEVFVGRIRRDDSRENCFNMWVVADNLRKGAALNGVQIAEWLSHRGLL